MPIIIIAMILLATFNQPDMDAKRTDWIDHNCALLADGYLTEQGKEEFQSWLDSQDAYEITVDEICEI